MSTTRWGGAGFTAKWIAVTLLNVSVLANAQSLPPIAEPAKPQNPTDKPTQPQDTPLSPTPTPVKSAAPVTPAPEPRPAPTPAVVSSPDTGWIRISGQAVNVRAKPDLNATVVARVPRDSVHFVAGRVDGWYMIVPPVGTFALVSMDVVARDGGTGIITTKESGSTVRIRAGSTAVNIADPLRSEVLTKLNPTATVQIIGEQPNWLQIAVPDGVCFYVSSEFAVPIAEETALAMGGRAPPVWARTGQVTGTPAGDSTVPPPAAEALRPVTQPQTHVAAAPAGVWSDRLRLAEAGVEAEARKPAPQQVWNGLINDLRGIAAQTEDDASAGRARSVLQRVEQYAAGASPSTPMPPVMAGGTTGQPTRTVETIDLSPGTTAAAKPSPAAVTPTAVTGSTGQPAATPPKTNAPPAADRVGFDAEGLMNPTFAIPAGPYGLRYKLEDPSTHKVRAYIEFPTELKINSTAFVGRYVGINGTSTLDASLEVPIYRVTRLTVLTPDRPIDRPRRP
jgi:hypothetical protein